MAGWDSYRRFEGPDDWDAIVVGSGIGGLTAAVLLAKHGGKRVLVLERHYEAGGFTHTFRRPGYEWDVGVHYIGDVGRDSGNRRMFAEVVGDELEWAPMPDVYDRVILGEDVHDYVTGKDRLRDRLVDSFPDRAEAIDLYLGSVEAAAGAAFGYFAEKAVPAPVAMLAGWWMRGKFLRWARRTTREVLEEITADQRLIGVLTGQWGDYGSPPAESSFAIHAVVTRHYWNGGFYPVGGAGRIARGARDRLEEHGSRLLVSAPVDRILLEGARVAGVRMDDGRELRAPLVVSAAGARVTLGELTRDDGGRLADLRRRIDELPVSMGHLGLYLGLDATDEELGLEGTNLWIYPDEHHEDNLARFLADPEAPLPLVYVSFPSRKDPSFQERFPGRATVEVIAPARFDWVEEWQDRPWRNRGDEYEAFKERMTGRLQEVLFRQVPQLRGHVSVAELSTPLSTRHFANAPRGEIYGIAHTPARFLERGLRPRTSVKGLWLTGQDVATCGVAGAMFGGALTATAALGRPVIQRVLRGSR